MKNVDIWPGRSLSISPSQWGPTMLQDWRAKWCWLFKNTHSCLGWQQGGASDPGRAEALEVEEVPAWPPYKLWTPPPTQVCLKHSDQKLNCPAEPSSTGEGRGVQNRDFQNVPPAGLLGHLPCWVSVQKPRDRQGYWLTLACTRELPGRLGTKIPKGQIQQHWSKIQVAPQIADPKVVFFVLVFILCLLFFLLNSFISIFPFTLFFFSLSLYFFILFI